MGYYKITPLFKKKRNESQLKTDRLKTEQQHILGEEQITALSCFISQEIQRSPDKWEKRTFTRPGKVSAGENQGRINK